MPAEQRGHLLYWVAKHKPMSKKEEFARSIWKMTLLICNRMYSLKRIFVCLTSCTRKWTNKNILLKDRNVLCCRTEFLSISVMFITCWFYVEEESLLPPKNQLLEQQRGHTTNHKQTMIFYSPSSALTGPWEGRGRELFRPSLLCLETDFFWGGGGVLLPLAFLIFLSSLRLQISESISSKTSDSKKAEEFWVLHGKALQKVPACFFR